MRREARELGTMVAYGFPRGDLSVDLNLARTLGASCLEILPDWRSNPSPERLDQRVGDAGFHIHSVHASWGGQCREGGRVDLGSPVPETWQFSLDELRHCLDWAAQVGARVLVVHPGGLSEAEAHSARADSLTQGLAKLVEGLDPESGPQVCVENMPPGVHPGTRMQDLLNIVQAVNQPALALALDTGHAQLHSTPAAETREAGLWLRTTHVHDNNGRQDSHLPPGRGVIDWRSWREALDEVAYTGPIMLECIRQLRDEPSRIDDDLRRWLSELTGGADPATG